MLPGLKPYQPNHRSNPPLSGDRQIVRKHGTAAVALELASQARPENNGASQRNESADGVHDRRSREVMETRSQRREEIAGLPMVARNHPAPTPSGR